MAYENVLLALRGKEDEGSVIHEAIRLTSHLNAQLTVVHVNSPGAGKAHMMMDAPPLLTAEGIRKWFAELGYPQEAEGVKIIVLEGERYARVVAEAADGYDLVIAGHHPKSLLKAMVTDATDERMADRLTRPLLLVPCIM